MEGGMWRFLTSVAAVPTGVPVHLAVIDKDGVHALIFPCFRVEDSWVDAETNTEVDVEPTHWREWTKQ